MVDEEYLAQLEKLQMCELDIAKEIDRICQEHNIKYVVTGGTLLGAIRHGGFIPWDDDLDIAMPRKDYKKFLQICADNLKEPFFLQTWQTDPNYAFAFAKVQIRGTIFAEYNAERSGAQNGIFVDVFPLDNMPESKSEQQALYKQLKFYKTLMLCKCKYNYAGRDSKLQKCLFQVMKVASVFVSKGYIKNKIDIVIDRFNKTESGLLTNLFGAYAFGKESFESDCLKCVTRRKFEDTELNIPGTPEVFLIRLYNDYMKLPPEDKRYNRHNALKISFGNYIPKSKR